MKKNNAINPAPSYGVLNSAGKIFLIGIHPCSKLRGILGRGGIKIFFLLILCSALFFLLWNLAKPKIKNIDSKGRNIICFGNSITFGYGAESRENYPLLLSKLVGIEVINAGVNGDTAANALARIETDVLTREPLLVIVEFGGNDFLERVPLKETLANLEKIIDLIQAKGAMAALTDVSAGLFLRQYRPAYYRLCRKKGAIFIPSIMAGLITNPSMKSDFFHPNAKGYSIINQRVYKAILPYLDKNRVIRSASLD